MVLETTWGVSRSNPMYVWGSAEFKALLEWDKNKGIWDYAVKHAQFFEADSLRLGLTTFTRSLKKKKKKTTTSVIRSTVYRI